MNFARGAQMIVHDPRLNNPGPPPTPLRPPAAMNVWTVNQATDTPEHIVAWSGTVGRGTTAGALDALHFLAHGNRAYVQIGVSGFTARNVSLFGRLSGMTRTIVFWSCLVGSDNQGWYHGHPEYFGQQVARLSGARTVMAISPQTYSWPGGTIDFGDWEGEVDEFLPDGSWNAWQSPNPFRQEPRANVERMIFGG